MWCSIVPRDILTILFLCGCHIIGKTAAVVHTVGMFHFSGFKSRPGECRLFRMTDGDEKIGWGYFRQRERTYWCLERLELEIVPWDKTRHVPYVSNCRYNCPVTATFDCVLGSRPGPIWKPSMPSSLETAGKWILWGVHATEFCGVYLYPDWVYVQADEGWRVRGLEWETMNIFRTYSENNPNIYWTNTEHIPNIYQTYTEHILIYWTSFCPGCIAQIRLCCSRLCRFQLLLQMRTGAKPHTALYGGRVFHLTELCFFGEQDQTREIINPIYSGLIGGGSHHCAGGER